MKYTIVNVISAYKIFGAEKIVISESQALQKKGFKVVVMGITPSVSSPFSKEVRQSGLPYCQLVSKLKFDLGAIFKLRSFLRKEKCDLVLSNKYKADIIALIASRMAKIPIVATVHGWCSEDWKARIYEKIQAYCWRFFDRVICVSNSYKDKVLRAGVPEKKISVIHNGIMVDNYNCISKDIERKRISFLKKHNIPATHFVVGIVGRLSIEKGYRYFVEAAQQVLKHESNVSFIIAGDGPEESFVRKLIDRLGLNGHIHMVGYIKEMKEIYVALDAVVIASLREGLPNALLEAMLYEKPVIATNVGGIPEVIRNNEDGLLVPPKNSSAIADALITIIQNPGQRRHIASAAKRRVLERFTFERRMVQVENLYKEVIEGYKRNQ